ncbi:DedA family protein [Natronomonas pharaonis DSM 2160]|uniref:DedA family protein n=1 Tax=Natronomonas pharaonis (strain ATCC 35678 / DSM 2160 / CIP 103997 / JCM 8858 / NBRC 14720 / NCIMB 2260 / Gabara) TaxID=348780 RepID=A0A1U7EYX1_NATPD|nr:VTT domain-containing protein [Natronomonas pharaonis]CAI50448.1 DedA family protein [Natronomonas pharaonis DSM 2160]
MLETLADVILSVLRYVGLPALFVFFIMKGAFIAKPIPTTVILPGYVLVVSADRIETATIILVSTVGFVAGQLLVYYLARREGLSSMQSSSRIHIPSERIDQAERWFKRYGGLGVFVTNFVPYLRGLIFIPAGVTRYPVLPLAFFAFASTLIYHTVIVAIAVGAVRAIL